MSIIQTIILAIVEGLTEFLPISSTGHLIITSSFMGIEKDEFVKLFEVAVQLGAILAVVVIYRKKFFDFTRLKFYVKLIIGVIPAIILGLLFSKKIDTLLESPMVVALSLLAGGIILLFVDRIFINPVIDRESKINVRRVFYHRHLAMSCNDSRSQPQRRFYCWRHAAKTYKKSSGGVFFFSCRTNHVCRNRLQIIQIIQ